MAIFTVSADLYLNPEVDYVEAEVESSFVSTLLTSESERCFAEWNLREIADRFGRLYCWENGHGWLVCEEADSWIPGSIGRAIATDPDNVGSATFHIRCDEITTDSWKRFVKLMKG
jgi:hypothetical protein